MDIVFGKRKQWLKKEKIKLEYRARKLSALRVVSALC